MANTNTNEEVRKGNVEATVSKAEQFYNDNKKVILGIFAAVIIAGIAVLAYFKFIYGPQCEEAQAQLYPAEQLFAEGNYETALNGDGNILGFAQIIDEYGKKGGKAVYLYAGISALQLEQFEDAIAYLKKYDGKDPILAPRAKACEGDALVGLGEGNYGKAADCFLKAAEMSDNVFAAAYLLKAGVAFEAAGDNAKALECYNGIKENYPQSLEAVEIEKYIARLAE